MSTPDPGWYPDPTTPGSLRYFDGAAWTAQTMTPAAPSAGTQVVPAEPLEVPVADAQATEDAPARRRRTRRGWIPWAAGASVIVVGGAAAGIVLLVRGPSEVDVPETVGNTVSEASATLEELGLVVEANNSLSGTYVEDGWTITKSEPKGVVAPGSTVRIWAESALVTAAKSCSQTNTVIDDGRALSLDTGYNSQNIDPVVCVLNALNVTDAVVSHMDSTRALDGRQIDSWNGIAAEWTYHPDSGMDLILRLGE